MNELLHVMNLFREILLHNNVGEAICTCAYIEQIAAIICINFHVDNYVYINVSSFKICTAHVNGPWNYYVYILMYMVQMFKNQWNWHIDRK